MRSENNSDLNSLFISNTTAVGEFGELPVTGGSRSNSSASASPAAGARDKRLYYWAKRIVDMTLAIIVVVALLPFLLLVAIAIKLDSSGPVIFRQERVGYDWRRRKLTTFQVCKFRSMLHNCDQTVHEQLVQDWVRNRKGSVENPEMVKLTNDRRITRVGRLLRQTSLDELPQLWNVLKGEMSLVGPRPVPLYEVAEYEPWHRRRLEALPGITGPWQVKGRGLTSVDDMARMDIEYIERQSVLLDLELMLQTIPVVLSRRGAC